MLSVLLLLVLLGVGLWCVESYVPMSPPIKVIIRVVVVICVVIWLLRVFGVSDIPVPRLRPPA